jgi:hypothetical protein
VPLRDSIGLKSKEIKRAKDISAKADPRNTADILHASSRQTKKVCPSPD